MINFHILIFLIKNKVLILIKDCYMVILWRLSNRIMVIVHGVCYKVREYKQVSYTHGEII
jgi:hypothetical protein